MKYIKVLLWATVIILMAVIFKFSAQPAVQSNESSTELTQAIVNGLPKTKDLPINEKTNIVTNFNSMVRKYAHFTLYLLLGIFTLLAMKSSFRSKSLLLIWAMTLLLCLIYAISDEVHQIFVPGRSCSFLDVLIDFSGSFAGSGIITGIIIKMRHK